MNTRLEAAAAETANQRDEAQAEISSMEQREADLVQQVESLTADVETMRNASSGAEGLQASVAALEQQLESKSMELEMAQESAKELGVQAQTYASSAERLGGELASLQGQLDEMEDMNTRLEAAAAETANQRDEAQAQISSMEQRE